MSLRSTATQHVSAPPARLFALATDFAGAPQRIAGIKRLELLTPGPVGVGTKFRETRVMFGKEATETMEVVDFQPGRSYTLRAVNCGCEYRTTVSVAPAPGGSQITFDFNATALTFGAKVMGMLMGWLVKNACAKAVRQDLLELKAAAEQATPA